MARRLIPNRGKAVLTLNPDTGSPITVTVYSAWQTPLDSDLDEYGHVNLQADATKIHILQSELNPANNGYEIRALDQIVFNGSTFQVTRDGATLETVLSCWACVCKKIIPTS